MAKDLYGQNKFTLINNVVKNSKTKLGVDILLGSRNNYFFQPIAVFSNAVIHTVREFIWRHCSGAAWGKTNTKKGAWKGWG